MLVETASGRRGYRPGQYAEEDADASMVSFSLFFACEHWPYQVDFWSTFLSGFCGQLQPKL